jgi:hypothetical protein
MGRVFAVNHYRSAGCVVWESDWRVVTEAQGSNRFRIRRRDLVTRPTKPCNAPLTRPIAVTC